MQIPETPARVEDLDLMRRLRAYADGSATWHGDGAPVGENARKECARLHTALSGLVDKALASLLDRITAREMETFTMHDRRHGNKVAHLMWHILAPERRERLTPPEIGMLVAAAFLHDVGMALTPAEREARLDPESDLWERLELDEAQKQAMDELRARARDEALGETQRRRAERQLAQAEEALLSQDTRDRHATRERYEEVLNGLIRASQADPERVPDPRTALSFDGDSFRAKLVEVCVSHNQDAESLVESDPENFEEPRFPRDYPVGCCTADLHLVAAALRLADILDFDRERTPPVLFHYLLPGPLSSAAENRSVLEWGKHLTISNWHIEDEAVVFRGRSTSHVVHHAVVQFAGEIEREVDATRATFGAFQKGDWPFALPKSVQEEIKAEGYKYVPYRFELDDERVYTLLMGGAIYDNPLVALRELIQNAVDACKLRDALVRMHQPEMEPKKEGRITVTYREPDEECASPMLVVEDTGTGMDAWVLERYFLKVGRSYYRSSEFSHTRVGLRKCGLDFAPVSEFGIGFLSCFLIADQVRVETAMADSVRRDTIKRTLVIDGPTRLIRLQEENKAGPAKHRGTRISLLLTRGGGDEKAKPPKWEEVRRYVEHVCQDLPYPLTLVRVAAGIEDRRMVEPRGTHIEIPPQWAPFAVRIPFHDLVIGIEGEMVLLTKNSLVSNKKDKQQRILVDFEGTSGIPRELSNYNTGLLRGGFLVGEVPGMPKWSLLPGGSSAARIRLTWKGTRSRRYLGTDIARTEIRETPLLATAIFRIWFEHLLDEPQKVPAEILSHYAIETDDTEKLLADYNALRLYHLARPSWIHSLPPSKYSLTEWERGVGRSIPDHTSGICDQLLSLLLPRITHRLVDKTNEVTWLPPGGDWRAHLDRPLKDIPSESGNWAYYTEVLNHYFFACTPGTAAFLNISFAPELSAFTKREHARILMILVRITFAPFFASTVLDKNDAELLARLAKGNGDLLVTFDKGRRPIQLRDLYKQLTSPAD
jgi:hypothetical protein